METLKCCRKTHNVPWRPSNVPRRPSNVPRRPITFHRDPQMFHRDPQIFRGTPKHSIQAVKYSTEPLTTWVRSWLDPTAGPKSHLDVTVAWYKLVWVYSLAKGMPLHTVWQCLACRVQGMSMVNSLWGTHIRPPPGTLSHPM